MQETPKDITYLGRVNFRNDRRSFGIRRADRASHLYVLGKTGTGKSTLLHTMVLQDLDRGDGVALVDPHGDLVRKLLLELPERRVDDVLYLNLSDPAPTIYFNPLCGIPVKARPFVASSLVEAFKKIWSDSWGVRMEHILRNALLTLLDLKDSTLGDLLPLLEDKTFRLRATRELRNPQVAHFWTHEFANYSPRTRLEAIAPIQNKIGALLSDPVVCSVLTKPQSSFDLRRLMDERQVLLVNLAKGHIGDGPAALLGAILVSLIGSAALSRSNVDEDKRPDFYVYLDEFQTYTTESVAGMLAELRKYHVNLTLANQHLSQVDGVVADAILGNVGGIISFRVGPKDAALLAKEFYPPFAATDLVNLPNHSVVLRFLINGEVCQPFSARTILPSEIPQPRL